MPVTSRLLRKLEGLNERRRMKQIRRDPAQLTASLRAAATILVVCHGNIIRSPFAARLMAQMLRGRASLAIASAGVAAIPGNPADPAAVVAASRFGVRLDDHAAALLTHEMVGPADVIFVMDVLQLVAIRTRFPQARGKTYLMATLCRDHPLEVQDPFGGDAARIQECYAGIHRVVTAIIRVIAGETRSPVVQAFRPAIGDS